MKSVIVPKRTDRSHVGEANLEREAGSLTPCSQCRLDVLMHLVPELAAAQEGLTAKEDEHELDRDVRLSDVYDHRWHRLQLW